MRGTGTLRSLRLSARSCLTPPSSASSPKPSISHAARGGRPNISSRSNLPSPFAAVLPTSRALRGVRTTVHVLDAMMPAAFAASAAQLPSTRESPRCGRAALARSACSNSSSSSSNASSRRGSPPLPEPGKPPPPPSSRIPVPNRLNGRPVPAQLELPHEVPEDTACVEREVNTQSYPSHGPLPAAPQGQSMLASAAPQQLPKVQAPPPPPPPARPPPPPPEAEAALMTDDGELSDAAAIARR